MKGRDLGILFSGLPHEQLAQLLKLQQKDFLEQKRQKEQFLMQLVAM